MRANMPIIEILKRELINQTILKKCFPFFLAPGVVDYSETIHSLGINYLTAVGRETGYLAVSEYPVLVPKGHRFTPLGEVRPDIIWFDRDYCPVLLGEFERYDRGKKDKLRQKVENLVIAYHQMDGKAKDLVLVFWAKGNENPGDIRPLISSVFKGFSRNGHNVPSIDSNSKLHLFKFVMKTLDNIHFMIGEVIHVSI